MDLAGSMEELARQNAELVRAISDLMRQVQELQRRVDRVETEYYKHTHAATSSGGITTTISLPS